ncbi:MAG: SAM-dependent methyltransferase [Planctomycetota bacterium]|nr:MAG: SAM-dependent methyltransferase [Planctomycetota bacterium]
MKRTGALRAALERRRQLIEKLQAEGTDCYRLLHGATEGVPGSTVDRYGPLLLVQTWREPLAPGELETLAEIAGGDLLAVWNHRAAVRGQGRSPDYGIWHELELPDLITGQEQGLRFDVRPRHHGLDPLLFLDLRAGRRQLRQHAKGASVLNLFAYTCGVGLAAAAGGASEVWNVDFASSALKVGRENAKLNPQVPEVQRFIHEDCLPTMRQLAGLPPGGRRGKTPPFERFAARSFDLVVLDPPRWARSPFGAVDVIRDYPSLLKPALLATAPGGQLLISNHVASVGWNQWMDVVTRCASKAGRPLASVERIFPDADLPSPDGQAPLKMAWLTLS